MTGYGNIMFVDFHWLYSVQYSQLLYEKTNKMHLFICIYSKICTLHVSNEYNVHHQESTYHRISSCLYISCWNIKTIVFNVLSHANIKNNCFNISAWCVQTAAYAVIHRLLMMNVVFVRNMWSANFRINTYEKVYLVGLFIQLITTHGLYNIKIYRTFSELSLIQFYEAGCSWSPHRFSVNLSNKLVIKVIFKIYLIPNVSFDGQREDNYEHYTFNYHLLHVSVVFGHFQGDFIK